MKIEKCGCDESQHLRQALKAILRMSTEDTHQGACDDLAQIGNLADQAQKLQKLKGDPGVGDVGPYLEGK